MVASLRRLPVWMWLATIVAASATLRVVLARGIPAPFIMVDEVVWAELARGIADHGEPVVRGSPEPGFGIVYPLLVSPAYVLFDALPAAYAAVKVINSVLMSLAAIPAYLLARRVVGSGHALLAAALAVAVPSLAYTGTVMTENAFYPLFLVVALVLVLTLEQPAWWRVLALVALVVAAYATRVQAVAVVPAALLAPLALALFQRRGLRKTFFRYRVLYGTFVVFGLAALVLQLVLGRTLQDLLGAYSPVGSASYDLGDALRYLAWHAEELVLYLLVLPVAAAIVLVGRAGSLPAAVQAFLAVLVALTVSFVPVVAVFASHFSGRVEERNLFYLAPLFVIALVAWIELGAPRPPVLGLLAAGAPVLLVLLFPFSRFISTSAITDTLMLLPWWSLQDDTGSGWIKPLAVALALALAGLFLLVPRRYAVALPLVVLVLWGVALKPIWWGTHGFERFSRGSLFQGIRSVDRDWIDRSLPSGAEAAIVWSGRTDRLVVHENEFFNRAVGPVYYVGSRTPGGLPEKRIRIVRGTGAVTLADGEPVLARYIVADSSIEPDGSAIASDKELGVTLWRVKPPLVFALQIEGLYPGDTWSAKTVTWERRRCAPGRLLVSLTSDASLFLRPQTVSARTSRGATASVRLRPDGKAVLKVPVEPDGDGTCRVAFTVTPTAVPKQVLRGSDDPRVLGAHFTRFLYEKGRT